jgi:hypothetical protein
MKAEADVCSGRVPSGVLEVPSAIRYCSEFARAMLQRALDLNIGAAHRRGRLLALAVLAAELESAVRAELFPYALEIANGRHDRDEPPLWPQHPLSLVEVHVPPSGLGVEGLRRAAALVEQPEQAARVELAAIELLDPGSTDRFWEIAQVLNTLPGDFTHLKLADLAVRPEPALRAGSAVRWA